MSMYAVKNDKGEWYDWRDMEFWDKDACTFVATGNQDDAEHVAAMQGVHVVELIEAPAKVVVSEEEAEMLERAKNKLFQEAGVIYHYANGHDAWRLGNDIGDRLMRAYVNGYTMAKEKKYNVKVPHTEKTLYRKHDSGVLFASIYVGLQNHANDFLFTIAEIEHYGLGGCQKVVVVDSAKTTREARDE